MTLLSGCVDNNLAPGLRAALVARFLLGIRCASRCVLAMHLISHPERVSRA
jgi:hypothetical protein